jgi:uncharacterized protein (DUF486 family)
MPAMAKTVGLLFCSNLFMTAAWYGHLRYRNVSLVSAIALSWGIALFEYVLQVPANRIGYGAASAYQLKIMQEAIALTVFAVSPGCGWARDSRRATSCRSD